MRKSIVVAALAIGVGVTIGSMHAQAPAARWAGLAAKRVETWQ